MTAVKLLWVKFQGTLCARRGQGKTSCFSPQSQSHMSCGADTKAHPVNFSACWKLKSGVPHCPSFLPTFHRRGQPHAIIDNISEIPHFPIPLLLTDCSISALAAFRGALRRERVKSRGHLQPSFSCCQEKRL